MFDVPGLQPGADCPFLLIDKAGSDAGVPPTSNGLILEAVLMERAGGKRRLFFLGRTFELPVFEEGRIERF
jgi:hypothetical protein